MTDAAQKETMEFQAEVRQLLNLMIHSLYSNKEIFLRELVSNASDAADKMRFRAVSDGLSYGDDSELKIRVKYDADAKTITISDNGIGMTRDEVVENIGTIAKSGTKQFLDSLTGDKKTDTQLIGQFGVGFYSAFIVADKVTVHTRAAEHDADQAVRWESDGEGTYTLENVPKDGRGTDVILHLRDDETEFLNDYRLENVIKTYSDHISLPIELEKTVPGENEDDAATKEWQQINSASALWSRGKSDISDEEYNEFYKHMSMDFQDPMAHVHNHVEGNQSYTTLFYVPQKAPYDMWDRDQRHGVKLYVRRVFIMDDAENLMPRYLRFIRGIVDSADLPLNVSREILQNNKVIDRIRSGSVKKVLGLLEKIAKDEPEKYQAFWGEFGRVLKEGPGEDFANQEKIAGLLRFASTKGDGAAQTVSLADYIERMKEGQDSIYYITAENFAAASNSPHLEIFKKNDIEVLLLTDTVDEWLVSHLHQFQEKSLVSIAKGDLDLGDLVEDKEDLSSDEKEAAIGIAEKVKQALGDKVKDVRLSKRLTDSPACLVVEEGEMAVALQKMLKAAGQSVPNMQPILELNGGHALVKKLDGLSDETLADWAHVLFDQAYLLEGGQLDDPSAYVNRLNSLLINA